MSINRPSRVNSTNRVTGNLTVDADGLSAVVTGGDGNNTPGNGYKYFRFETSGPFNVGSSPFGPGQRTDPTTVSYQPQRNGTIGQTLESPDNVSATGEILLVGGGGGASSGIGGGGAGGGGVRMVGSVTLSSGTVTVGSGGPGANRPTGNGGDSTFLTYTAGGGEGGAGGGGAGGTGGTGGNTSGGAGGGGGGGGGPGSFGGSGQAGIAGPVVPTDWATPLYGLGPLNPYSRRFGGGGGGSHWDGGSGNTSGGLGGGGQGAGSCGDNASPSVRQGKDYLGGGTGGSFDPGGGSCSPPGGGPGGNIRGGNGLVVIRIPV